MPFLAQFSVVIIIEVDNTVPHSISHQLLVKQKLPLLSKLLQFTERNRFCLRTLDNFLNSVLSILGSPALHEFFCVVRIISERPDIVPALHDVMIQIIIHFHHVQHSAVHDHQTSFIDECLILLAHGSGKFAHCVLGNIIDRLDSEFAGINREEERKRTEVVTLRKVGSHGTWHLPVFAMPMGECLIVREEVGIAFHRQSEPLGENIVFCCRNFLSSLHVQLVSFVTHRLANVRIGLKPVLRLADFVQTVERVPPDAHMRVDVIALKDGFQLHFDGVANSIPNGAF